MPAVDWHFNHCRARSFWYRRWRTVGVVRETEAKSVQTSIGLPSGLPVTVVSLQFTAKELRRTWVPRSLIGFTLEVPMNFRQIWQESSEKFNLPSLVVLSLVTSGLSDQRNRTLARVRRPDTFGWISNVRDPKGLTAHAYWKALQVKWFSTLKSPQRLHSIA